jgi:hypothetical protein
MRGKLCDGRWLTGSQYQSLYPYPNGIVGQSSFMEFAIPPQSHCRRTPAIRSRFTYKLLKCRALIFPLPMALPLLTPRSL